MYMDTKNLVDLKNQIEELDKIHHVKILKILKDNQIKFSENRNGIFINMNSFNEETIISIQNTLNYINEQEKQLKDIETIKTDLQNDFFIKGKEVKDTTTNSIISNEY